MKLVKSAIACALVLSGVSAANAEDFSMDKVTFSPYARVVGGLNYVDNSFKAGISGNKVEVASNQWGTSYIGSSVTIDLGNDFDAFTNLEIGFGTLNGQTNKENTLFNRQANLGVKHQEYGQLSVGTHLMPSQDILDMDPMQFQSIGINTLVNGVNDLTAENSIMYRSPELYGVSFAYLHKFGGEVADSERSSASSFSLAYRNGGFKVRGIYQESADEFGHYTGGDFYGLGTQGQWINAKTHIIAASYETGPAKFTAGYQHVEAPDAGYLLSYTFDDEADMVWIGTNYAISKKLTANIAAYQLEQDYSGKKSSLYTVGLNYEVNKYFTLYSTLGYIHNNEVDEAFASDVGVNNHALSYDEVACEDVANCNGASQLGGYTGIVIKL